MLLCSTHHDAFGRAAILLRIRNTPRSSTLSELIGNMPCVLPRCAVEDVNLLQRQVLRLWITEVYQRYKREVEAHPNEIGLPLKVLDGGWSDHDDEEVLKRQSSSASKDDLPRASSMRFQLLFLLLGPAVEVFQVRRPDESAHRSLTDWQLTQGMQFTDPPNISMYYDR